MNIELIEPVGSAFSVQTLGYISFFRFLIIYCLLQVGLGLRRRTGPAPVYDDSKAWESVVLTKDLIVCDVTRTGSNGAPSAGPGASES
jgi:hypothetical protein